MTQEKSDGGHKSKKPDSTESKSSGPCSQIQLWQFLLEHLDEHVTGRDVIKWETNFCEFRIIDHDELAKLWGQRKRKPNMNYDKLSRALRYYYEKNILTKIAGKRYSYRFDFSAIVAEGYNLPKSVYTYLSKFPPMASYSNQVISPIQPHAMYNTYQCRATPMSSNIYNLSPPNYNDVTSGDFQRCFHPVPGSREAYLAAMDAVRRTIWPTGSPPATTCAMPTNSLTSLSNLSVLAFSSSPPSTQNIIPARPRITQADIDRQISPPHVTSPFCVLTSPHVTAANRRISPIRHNFAYVGRQTSAYQSGSGVHSSTFTGHETNENVLCTHPQYPPQLTRLY